VKISREDFDHWLANPVTEAVRAAAKQTVEEAKAKWLAMSWDGSNCDPIVLAEVKGVAQIARDYAEFEWNDLPEEMRDDEEQPERNQPNRI
jgi:hypothetical protein